MTKQEEIQELRNRLLELGQPVVIPGSELPQPETAREPTPKDIILYPYREEIRK